MALVKVSWYQTEHFETEIEVDGYDPETTDKDDEQGPIMGQLIELDADALAKDFEGCTDRQVTNVEVIREGDLTPEIKPARKQYEEMF